VSTKIQTCSSAWGPFVVSLAPQVRDCLITRTGATDAETEDLIKIDHLLVYLVKAYGALFFLFLCSFFFFFT
jgi:hypothetical protein